MSLTLQAPVAGVIIALEAVPDPVFAQAIIGPGLAIEPSDQGTTAHAPLAGRIAKIHPHAFVIETADGRGLLVHLGLNTIELGGAGFTLHAADGDLVEPGQRLISWDPAAVRASGRSAVTPVVAMQAEPDDLRDLVAPGTVVAPGDPLMTWA